MRDASKEIPGLAASERAFEVELGKKADGAPRTGHVVVRITRGTPSGDFLPVKVEARQVAKDGKPVHVQGVPVQIPAKVISIAASAMAEGTLQMQNEVAAATVEAVERTKKHVAALEAWFVLPGGEPDA